MALVKGNYGNYLQEIDLPRSKELQEEALAWFQANDNQRMQGVVLQNLALIVRDEDPLGAVPMFEEALALHRSVDNRRSEAVTLGNLGFVLACTSPEDGWALIEEAAERHRQVGNARSEALCLARLAGDRALFGRFDEAARNGRAALAIQQRIHNTLGHAQILTILADIAHWAGRTGERDALSARAEPLYHQAKERVQISYHGLRRATWALFEGRFSDAHTIAIAARSETTSTSERDLSLLAAAAAACQGDRAALSDVHAFFHTHKWVPGARKVRAPISSGLIEPLLLLSASAASCGEREEAIAAHRDACALAQDYGFSEGSIPHRQAAIVTSWLREEGIDPRP